jgi:formylglycine-generating enzyme required for sulfatase activity
MKKAHLTKWIGVWLSVTTLIMPAIGFTKPSKITVDVISKGEFVIFLFKNRHRDKDFQCAAEVTANIKDDEGNVALRTINAWNVTLPANSLEIEVEAGKEVISVLKNEMIYPRIVKFVENSRSYECKPLLVYLTPDKKVFRDRLKDGSLGPEMVWIPAGSFQMGDIQGGGANDEQPVHRVSVEKFAMGRYEITFAEYDKFAQATGREKPDDEGWGRGNRPVINVSWRDVKAYADWLSQQTGQNYRLPTEAEWEYAARAGTNTKYWWGNEIGANKANCNSDCKDNFEYTAPVGSFMANPFGLHDTVGNVWEWTCSEYENRYRGKEKRCVSNAPLFVLRGGSWFNIAWGARAAFRSRNELSFRDDFLGVRLARHP